MWIPLEFDASDRTRMTLYNSTNRNIPAFPPPNKFFKSFYHHTKERFFHKQTSPLLLLFTYIKQIKKILQHCRHSLIMDQLRILDRKQT